MFGSGTACKLRLNCLNSLTFKVDYSYFVKNFHRDKKKPGEIDLSTCRLALDSLNTLPKDQMELFERHVQTRESRCIANLIYATMAFNTTLKFDSENDKAVCFSGWLTLINLEEALSVKHFATFSKDQYHVLLLLLFKTAVSMTLFYIRILVSDSFTLEYLQLLSMLAYYCRMVGHRAGVIDEISWDYQPDEIVWPDTIVRKAIDGKPCEIHVIILMKHGLRIYVEPNRNTDIFFILCCEISNALG